MTMLREEREKFAIIAFFGFTYIHFATFLLLAILAVLGGAEVRYFGPENDPLYFDVTICRGPDEWGIPTALEDEFALKDWQEVYACIYIVPDGVFSIGSIWFMEKSYLVQGDTIQIHEAGYYYLSLDDAITYSNNLGNPWLNDLLLDTEPVHGESLLPGIYHLSLFHFRDSLIKLSFRFR